MTTESSKRNGTVQKSAQRAIATPRAGPFALGRNESSATKLGAAEDGYLAPPPFYRSGNHVLEGRAGGPTV